MLYCIVYLSSSSPYLSEDDLNSILIQARTNNERLNVTGVLIHGQGSFIQVLEGKKEDLDTLYKKIAKDKRHFNLIRVLNTPIEHRSFEEWKMGFKRMNTEEEKQLLQSNFNLENPHFKNLEKYNHQVLSLLKTFSAYN